MSITEKPFLVGRRLLVCCDDVYHSGEGIRKGLAPLLEGSGLKVDWVDGQGLETASALQDYDCILLAKTNVLSSANPEPWVTREDTGFLRYVSEGGRLLAVHAGLTYGGKVPAIIRLEGGHFVQHPPPCEVTLFTVPGHPLSGCIPAPFVVTDEHYFVQLVSSDVSVFLHSQSINGVQPAGWTRTEGKGRVCALTPGHYPEVWLHPSYQQLLRASLLWLLDDSVR